MLGSADVVSYIVVDLCLHTSALRTGEEEFVMSWDWVGVWLRHDAKSVKAIVIWERRMGFLVKSMGVFGLCKMFVFQCWTKYKSKYANGESIT
jgi:hypothetical protein